MSNNLSIKMGEYFSAGAEGDLAVVVLAVVLFFITVAFVIVRVRGRG